MNNPGAVAVDIRVVLLTTEDGELRLLLVPGENGLGPITQPLSGAIDSLDELVAKLLDRRLGLRDVYFEQLYTFSSTRSPDRVHKPAISIAYLALVSESKAVAALGYAPGARFTSSEDFDAALPSLDHEIVKAALQRFTGKGAWSILPAYLLDEEFTLAQMAALYRALVGTTAQGESFRRKVMASNLLIPVEMRSTDGATKKSMHYRIRPGVRLSERHL